MAWGAMSWAMIHYSKESAQQDQHALAGHTDQRVEISACEYPV